MTSSDEQWMKAVVHSTKAEFRKLLGDHPDLMAESGPEIMGFAAQINRVDLLPLLVAAGGDVNAAYRRDTPLGSAANAGAFEAVRWLLDHGANVNGRAEDRGSTALAEAVTEGNLELVRYLMERGADPNLLHGNPKRNALAAARFWGHEDIAAYLEEQGVSEIVVEPEPVDVEHPDFSVRDEPDPIRWYEKKWHHVYDYAERHGLEALSEKNRLLFLVGYLVGELSNGGAGQFYANPSARYTSEIAEALDTIGASKAAGLVREIDRLFPDGNPAAGQESRLEEFDMELPPGAEPLGEELESILDDYVPGSGEPVVLRQLYDRYHAVETP